MKKNYLAFLILQLRTADCQNSYNIGFSKPKKAQEPKPLRFLIILKSTVIC